MWAALKLALWGSKAFRLVAAASVALSIAFGAGYGYSHHRWLVWQAGQEMAWDAQKKVAAGADKARAEDDATEDAAFKRQIKELQDEVDKEPPSGGGLSGANVDRLRQLWK